MILLKNLNNLPLSNWELSLFELNSQNHLLLKIPNDIDLNENINCDISFIPKEDNDINTILFLQLPDNNKEISFDLSKSNQEFTKDFLEFTEHSKKILLFNESTCITLVLDIPNDTITLLKDLVSEETLFENTTPYSCLEENILYPQHANSVFWMISLLDADMYKYSLDNIDTLELNADNFDGELVLYLNKDNHLIASIVLAEQLITEDIKNSFRTFLEQNSVQILLNDNQTTLTNVVNVSLEIHPNVKDRVRFYLEI